MAIYDEKNGENLTSVKNDVDECEFNNFTEEEMNTDSGKTNNGVNMTGLAIAGLDALVLYSGYRITNSVINTIVPGGGILFRTGKALISFAVAVDGCSLFNHSSLKVVRTINAFVSKLNEE